MIVRERFQAIWHRVARGPRHTVPPPAPPHSPGAELQSERSLIIQARQAAGELSQLQQLPDLPVDSIPGYTLIREIGRGGMGVIYEAQQKEPPRPVALKIMRGRSRNQRRLRLFRQEMETLARLSSPGIAAIYGAGSTEDGRHFFAMELVRGVSLNQYARLKQLSTREQLQLFRRVCEAVHYAHQRGVIHRDLKPSNIIVDAEGNPKILDFGLARITDAEESTQDAIDAGKIMGTLPYMSPEQAQGRHDEVDVRSDIYSLGIILYELLTERLPYDMQLLTQADARRAIGTASPVPPSDLRREVRGDVELIVLKALEKDPDRRYPSAIAFAEDIRRYLGNEPILARPSSAAYEFRKFLARHKALPIYATAAAGLLISFVAWWNRENALELERQMYDAQRQRSVAEWQAKERARQKQELQALRAEVADSLERLAAQLLATSDFEAAALLLRECLSVRRASGGEPAQQAWSEILLGRALTATGEFDEAERLLLRGYAALPSAAPDDRRSQAREYIVALYERWGRLELASAWRSRADSDPSEEP